MGQQAACPCRSTSASSSQIVADAAPVQRLLLLPKVEDLLDTPLPCSQQCVDTVAETISGPQPGAAAFAGAGLDVGSLAGGGGGGEGRGRAGTLAQGEFSWEDSGEKQCHLLTFSEELTPRRREELQAEFEALDVRQVRDALAGALTAIDEPLRPRDVLPPKELFMNQSVVPKLIPGTSLLRLAGCPQKEIQRFRHTGMEMLGSSSVAVVLLAGSEDRRLGGGRPTGVANIGLLSERSLFQIFCERLVRLKHLVHCYMKEQLAREVESQARMMSREMSEQMGISHSGKSTVDLLSLASFAPASLQVGRASRSKGSRSFTSEGGRTSQGSRSCMSEGDPEGVPMGPVQSIREAMYKSGTSIPLYIMCNDNNIEEIREVFEEGKYFGLPECDITFFEQENMPAMDARGQIFLEERHRIAMHPDGGGGFFRALEVKGVLADLRSRGMEHVFIASQDNLLLRIADPVFIGYCVHLKAKLGVKCFRREKHEENFGLLCTRRIVGQDLDGDGDHDEEEASIERHFSIVAEPGEVAHEVYTEKDGFGNILYDACNASQFYLAAPIVEKCRRKMPRRWHAVRKRQPYVNPRNGLEVMPPGDALNSTRLEMFVSDALEMCNKVVGLMVDRHPEFAYVKHMRGPFCPQAAIFSLSRLHYGWVCASGGRFKQGFSVDRGTYKCELSPLVTYAGEGLSAAFKGPALELPLHRRSRQEVQGAKQIEQVALSTTFLDPWSGVRDLEEQVLVQRVNRVHSIRCVGIGEGDKKFIEKSRAAEELPDTPDSLVSERENWETRLEDKIEAKLAELRAKQDEMHMDTSSEHDDDDDYEDDDEEEQPDNGGRMVGRQTTQVSIAFSNMPTVRSVDTELKEAARREMDTFAYTMKYPTKRQTPIARLPARSNIQSRGQSGYTRRLKFKCTDFEEGKLSLMGEASGYKPPKVKNPPGLFEQARSEAWGMKKQPAVSRTTSARSGKSVKSARSVKSNKSAASSRSQSPAQA